MARKVFKDEAVLKAFETPAKFDEYLKLKDNSLSNQILANANVDKNKKMWKVIHILFILYIY